MWLFSFPSTIRWSQTFVFNVYSLWVRAEINGAKQEARKHTSSLGIRGGIFTKHWLALLSWAGGGNKLNHWLGGWERQSLYLTRHCISSHWGTWSDNPTMHWWVLTSFLERDFKHQGTLVHVLVEECQEASWEEKNPELGVYDFGQVLYLLYIFIFYL